MDLLLLLRTASALSWHCFMTRRSFSTYFSNAVEGEAAKLEVEQEVEYSIYSRDKEGKVSAEGVKPLSRGSISKTPSKDDFFSGKVVIPSRSVNPDQSYSLSTTVVSLLRSLRKESSRASTSLVSPAFLTRRNSSRKETQSAAKCQPEELCSQRQRHGQQAEAEES